MQNQFLNHYSKSLLRDKLFKSFGHMQHVNIKDET